MTDAQKEARKKSAESGNIRWIKDHCLRTMEDDEDFVFISYKSDDSEKVLDDIIYNTCKKYGLRVYFDTAFDDKSDSWITQFYENMCSEHCKAFIAFLDDAYYSSYATLMEMMARKTSAAGGDYKEDSLFFLPINLGPITSIINGNNTGLGTKRYSNGKLNNHAGLELEKFNEFFSEIADAEMRKIYKRENDNKLYEEATEDSPAYGKMYLKVTQCRRLMELVIPHSNDNDGSNKDYVKAIYDKLKNAGLSSVFGATGDETEESESVMLTWDDFDQIKAFSYQGVSYNVTDAQNAYISIVDAICRDDATFDTNKVLDMKMPMYVKFEDGKELSIPKKGYGSILRAGLGQKEVGLYGENIQGARAAKTYEVLKRETPPTPPVPLQYTDTIEDFAGYFAKLSEKYKEYWQNSNNVGKTPSISMEIKIHFNWECLEYHVISGYTLKSMFVEMMQYFYHASGERYYNYAVDLCAKSGNKNPLIITEEYWNSGNVNQVHYSAINGSDYLFYNWYSAKDLIGAAIKQIVMYIDFLQKNGQTVSLSDVIMEYAFEERNIACMMNEIREAGSGDKKGKNPSTGGGATAETVAFAPESFVDFIRRFKQISVEYKEVWKKEHTGNTPPIPFTNIALHFPADVTMNAEIKQANWKPLFNAVMDDFCEFTNGDFCEMRIEKELQKNNKTPGVVPKEYYAEEKIPCARYQPIANGRYYFFNSYGAPELIKALSDEIRAYMNYLTLTKGIQEDIESVKISYELPVGFYADMFR